MVAAIWLPSSRAGDWTFTPSASLSETYSDNVFTAPSNEQSDFITTLSPGANLTGTGSRLNLATYYRLQNQLYADNSDLDDHTHFLGANASVEAIEDNLFVDVFASMYPTQINTLGRRSNRNFRNIQGNQADVISYGVTPRYVYHLGSWATFDATVNVSDTSTSSADTGGALAGSGGNEEWNFGLSSGRRFSIFTWNIKHSRRSSNFDSGAGDSTLESTDFGAGYRVNRLFKITGTIGNENNSFSGDQNQRSGASWSLGGTFTPTSRTSISGRFGKRSFGDTKSFEFSYRIRRVRISGSYSEDLNTSSDLLRRQQVFATRDVFGNPIQNPNPTGDLPIPTNNLGLLDQVFVSRRFNANIGFQQKRGSLTINVFHSEQEQTQNQSADKIVGTSVAWDHKLGYRLSTGVSADYQTRSSDSRDGNQTSIFITPYLSYSIGPHLSSRLNYSHAEESSDIGFDEYTENSVTGTLNYAF